MNLGLGLNLGGSAGGGGGGGVAPTYVFLGSTLAAAPALSGVPAGSTYLNASDTVQVSRQSILMRSRSAGTSASDSGGFASVPKWFSANSFGSAEFQLAAGTWQVGIIGSGAAPGATLTMVDDADGAGNIRQAIAINGQASSLWDTDDTRYTTAGTAIADVVAGMTLVPVLVTTGVLRIYATVGADLSAIALRAP